MSSYSLQWLTLAADASVKSLLLALTAAITLRALRLRDSQIRHRVWTGVLAGMLLLPVLSQVVPDLQLPFLVQPEWLTMTHDEAPASPPVSSAAVESTTGLEVSAEATTFEADEFSPSPMLDAARREIAFRDARSFSDQRSPQQDQSQSVVDVEIAATTTASPQVSGGASAPTQPHLSSTWRTRLLARWPQLILGFWLTGVAFITLRLLLGVLMAWRLKRASTEITPEDLAEFGVSRTPKRGGRLVPVLECPRIRVPLTLGFLRPVILLPEAWLEWPTEKLEAVLSHEQTHVERGDCAIAFLAEFNLCVNWFHPVAWWLRRVLSVLAEEACDDAAIGSIGDRATYARHLLEVAAAVSPRQGRLIQPGVAMARRSNVESRIDAILDFTRPLSERPTWATTLVIVALATPVIAFAAALRPASPKTTEDTTQPSPVAVQAAPGVLNLIALADKGADAKPKSTAEATPSRSYSGRVTDVDGRVIAGAEIWLSTGGSEETSSITKVSTTQQTGEFSVELTAEQAARCDERTGWPFLIAKQPGYGLDLLPLEVFANGPAAASAHGGRSETTANQIARVDQAFGEGRAASKTLKLRPQVAPVHGRLMTIEGKPLAGVKVVVLELQEPEVNTLLSAFERKSKDLYHKASHSTFVPGRYLQASQLRALIPAVTTDAKGSFTLPGLGRDQLATLTFEGERVDAETLHVFGRDMQAQRIPHVQSSPDGNQDTYVGLSFTHVVGPGVPVAGVVKDFKTGEPIADATVFVERLFRETGASRNNLRLDVRHIRTKTDGQGRYRLVGIPPGGVHVLHAFPPPTQPWLGAAQEFSVDPDAMEAKVDIQVFRGIWIEGRVTDATSGEPIEGCVDYMALRNNPNIPQRFGLEDVFRDGQFNIGPDGRYRTAGLPGPGVLMVRNLGKTKYPLAVGANSVPGYNPKDNSLPTTPTALPLSNWALLKPIDPVVDASSLSIDLVLSAGETVTGRVIGVDAKPPASFEAMKLVEKNAFWSTCQNGLFTLHNYDGKGPRHVFFRSMDLSQVGQWRLEGPAPKDVEVKLQPAVQVTGRLMETETDEPADGYHLYCNSSSSGPFRLEENLMTGSDGRFQIKGLVAGLTYRIHTASRRRFSSGKNNFTIDLTNAKPGDVIDLGEVTGKNATHAMLRSVSSAGDAMLPGNASKQDETKRVVKGRVLLPTGEPAVGAKIRSSAPLPWTLKSFVGEAFKPAQFETVTDSNGQFEIAVLTRPYGDVPLQDRWSDLWMSTKIVASMDGLGAAWAEYREIANSSAVTLQLVNDLPLRGQVVDIEGRPATSATVTVTHVRAAINDDLTAWSEQLKQSPVASELMKLTTRQIEADRLGLPKEVQTDKDGRFEIRGIGRDRVVSFKVVGKNLAYSQYQAVTREISPVQVNYGDMSLRETLFGSTIRIASQPSRPVEGVVLDAVTRKPLAGVLVESDSLAGTRVRLNRVLKTTTDVEGRFRLLGMPKGKGNALLITPNDEQPYFQRSISVADPVGLEPVTVEAELHRGVWITGKITDRITGEPAIGCPIHYLPLISNTQVQRLPEFPAGSSLAFDQRRFLSRTDGTYRVLGYYGPAIIGIGQGQKAYPDGQGFDEITAPKTSNGNSFDTHFNPVTPGRTWPMAMKQIDVPEGVDAQSLDFTLDPGAKIVFKLVDTAGQPVGGVRFNSRTGNEDLTRDVSSTREYGQLKLKPDEMHSATFFHPERQIGRVVKFSPEDVSRGAMTVELQPCAKVTGRVLTTTGVPLSHVSIRPHTTLLSEYGRAIEDGKTNKDGRFEISLLPGSHYLLLARGNADTASVKLADNVSSEPGSTTDLGDLRVAPEDKFSMHLPAGGSESSVALGKLASEKMPATSTPSPSSNSSAAGQAVSMTGRVQLPDGQAASGSHVALVGMESSLRSTSRDERIQLIAQSVVDRNGDFQLPPLALGGYRYLSIIAGQPGFGSAWRSLESIPRGEAISLQLKPERLIRGRLLDPEGNPAADVGVRVEGATVREADPEQAYRNSVGFAIQSPCPAFPLTTRTDSSGRFVVRQVGENCGVNLRTIENERFGAQELAINTGLPESRGPRDATYRPQSKNPGDGEASFVLSPAQWFEGTVRYADTKEPVPFAAMTIWASQQAPFGSMMSVPGKCDAAGHYRICPLPGVRFGITAYAPAGEPYLIKTTRDLTWSAGMSVNKVDLELPRGVLVRGTVANNVTGDPEANASIQYLPTDDTRSRIGEDVITGWQAIQNTGADGSFVIAVPEGEGTLLVHGRQGGFVLEEIGRRELSSRRPGGERHYAHAIIPVTTSRQTELEPLRVGLKPASKVTGHVIDQSGKPVSTAAIFTRLGISAISPTWRPFDQANVEGGQFQIGGLRSDRPEKVHVLDREHQLGATVELSAADDGRTITLAPCGKAAVKFVTAEGKPAEGYLTNLMFVMTPGSARLDLKAQGAGSLSADETFAVNLDRVNQKSNLRANADGIITFQALIPGAKYRLDIREKGGSFAQHEFVAESGKTLDLGEIKVTVSDE